jgi:HK97 family phage major capsid protein
MTKHVKLETRSEPIEVRDDDPLAAATQAVEDLRTSVTDYQTRAEQRLAAVDTLATRLAAVETRLNRPAVHTEQRNEPSLEQRAFNSFVRFGVERMPADEVRELKVANDTAGGYLVPQQFLTELDRNLVLFSPIRSVARIANASVGEVLLPKRTGTLNASWIEEGGPSPATQPTYGQQKFTIFELACHVDVSNRLLEDAAFNLESELAFDLAEEFGRAESAAFINGDGTGKPKGILSETGIETLSTSGGAITADHLIDTYHALPSAYARNGSWAMNRRTIGAVRKLKSAAGDYLWQDSLSAGNPPTILGRPVLEFPDLPDFDAAEPDVAIIFGDFKSGFRLFDRVNLSVLRDPYSVQVNGLVRFHARRRVGGSVTRPEAFKFLSGTSTP